MHVRSLLCRSTAIAASVVLLGAAMPVAGGVKAAPASFRSASLAPSTYLAVSPQSVISSNTTVKVTGCGFLPYELVNVVLIDPTTSTFAPVGPTRSIQATNTGCLSSVANNFKIAASVADGTSYYIRAQGGMKTLYGFVGVGIPALSINPSWFSYSSAGTLVNVSGGGFLPSDHVQFSLRLTTRPFTPLPASIASHGVGSGGTFSNKAYVVPASAGPGTYFLYVQGSGGAGATLALGLITIS